MFGGRDLDAHAGRLAPFVLALAREAGETEPHARLLAFASTWHDVGKCVVPRRILEKPGPLTEAEWAAVRTHPRAGAALLTQGGGDLCRIAGEIALRHHERWDGQGYPDGAVGEAIPRGARIVAVADVHDALCSDRVYKPAWSVGAARAEILGQSGRQFDPEIVAAYARLPGAVLRRCHDAERCPDAGTPGRTARGPRPRSAWRRRRAVASPVCAR